MNRRHHTNFRNSSESSEKDEPEKSSGSILKYLFVSVAAGLCFALVWTVWEQQQRYHQRREAALAALLEKGPLLGCNEVRAAGLAPLQSFEPGYSEDMDGDHDGVACEPYFDLHDNDFPEVYAD